MIVEIVCILFASVAANHLGLIGAMERVVRHELPILNCSRCLTFWATLVHGCYSVATGGALGAAIVLAISFLNAWLAVWLELGMGYIDTVYYYIYNKVYGTADATSADNEDSAIRNEGNSDANMPKL